VLRKKTAEEKEGLFPSPERGACTDVEENGQRPNHAVQKIVGKKGGRARGKKKKRPNADRGMEKNLRHPSAKKEESPFVDERSAGQNERERSKKENSYHAPTVPPEKDAYFVTGKRLKVGGRTRRR